MSMPSYLRRVTNQCVQQDEKLAIPAGEQNPFLVHMMKHRQLAPPNRKKEKREHPNERHWPYFRQMKRRNVVPELMSTDDFFTFFAVTIFLSTK